MVYPSFDTHLSPSSANKFSVPGKLTTQQQTCQPTATTTTSRTGSAAPPKNRSAYSNNTASGQSKSTSPGSIHPPSNTHTTEQSATPYIHPSHLNSRLTRALPTSLLARESGSRTSPPSPQAPTHSTASTFPLSNSSPPTLYRRMYLSTSSTSRNRFLKS
jgi:hypothetical protein